MELCIKFSLHFSSKAASLATSEKFLCFHAAVANDESLYVLETYFTQ